MSGRYLTLEERIEIEQGIIAGKCIKDIARKIGKNRYTVSCEIRKNSLKGEYKADVAQKKAIERVKDKNEKILSYKNCKKVTYETRKEIEAGIKENKFISDIAIEMGYSYSTIHSEIRKNGGIRNYTAEAAQNNVGIKKPYISKKKEYFYQQSIENTTELPKEKEDSHMGVELHVFMEKIENIEMQIDILTRAIQGLRSESK